MTGQTKHLTRNRKIEPLNWAETANAPALKGMMSFLDIKPEEVRSGHFKDVPSEPNSHPEPVGDSRTGSEALTDTSGARLLPPKILIEMKSKYSQASTSLPSSPDVHSETTQRAIGSDTLPIGDSHTGSDLLSVSVSPRLPNMILGSVPSQNRKIRKCRLSQDAHSAGEEMLYRILWEEGKPETVNPLGSRVVRIGYAELANKARMHKANVRLNLVNLTAKLAIEQSGDFNSRDMIAKAYRVLSYKEILERRRAAGLEYVIRQKNVVFVTANGEPIQLPGLSEKGRRKRQGAPTRDKAPQPASEALPVSITLPVSVSPIGHESTFNVDGDLACVSDAMNTYWTVDDAAVEQLIRACRAVRADAQADEIAFFVREKLELTRSNRAIKNPIGLILATVPQSFSGYSFDTFRKRHLESKRLAEEEQIRKAEENRALKLWLVQDAQETLANPSSPENRRLEAEKIIALYSEDESTH
jgi:hypothetical protein